MDSPDGDDRRGAGIEPSRHDRLERSDDGRGGDDRIDALVRTRPVRALAMNCDRERCRRTRRAARLRDHLSDREAPVDVPAEDCRHAVERPALEDRRRAVADFLGRLQHDQHVTARGLPGEKHRGADRPCRVHVVATGVHNAGDFGRVRQSGRFLNRQRIDVAANRDDRRLAIAARHSRDDAGSRHATDVADPDCAQRRLQSLGGLLFLPRKLGKAMQFASQLDQRCPLLVVKRKLHRS